MLNFLMKRGLTRATDMFFVGINVCASAKKKVHDSRVAIA